ncbi:MAG: hypothetical protein KDD51_03540 [Bdellovibrionales bacterium]|nr:hypothetical protein [Bdellovibrionales bacterium]
MKKREIVCSVNRSEVAVAKVEGEAEMQSRKVENTFGRRFVRLVAVATLFFSVAIPQNGFAKPSGEPSDKEVSLWHEVWKDKKWQEAYMEKFSADDLKADGDKMKAWMQQLEKKDEKLNVEFVSKFVSEAGTKNELSQPFKMAQAMAAVLIERTKAEIAKKTNATDDDKKKAFEDESEKLWKWLSEDSEAMKKAFGSKYKSFMKLLAKLLSSAKDGKKFKADGKDVKGLRPDTWKELEDLLKDDKELQAKLFEDEDKLGEEFQKHPLKKDDEDPKQDPKNDPKNDPKTKGKDDVSGLKEYLDQMLKAQDAKMAQLLQAIQGQQPQPGVGEQVDLTGLRNAVQAACNLQDNEDDQLNDLVALADQLRNAIDDNNDRRDRNDINDILNALDRNNDDNEEAAAAAAPPSPPASQAAPSEQPQLAQGDEGTPQIPPRQEIPQLPQQFVAQQPGSVVKAPANNTAFSGPSFDFGEGLITATQRMIRSNGQDENLLSNSMKSLRAFYPPAIQLQYAIQDKYKANADYESFKARRNVHEQKAESLKKDLDTYQKGFRAEFASANPGVAETLEKMDANERKLEELVKSETQRGQQQGAQGPAFDPNGVQAQIAQLKQVVDSQKAEKTKLERLRDTFIAEKDKEVKSLKAAYDKHLELAGTAKEQMDKAKARFEEAEMNANMLQASLGTQNSSVGTVPNVTGARQVTTGTGFNRFNTPTFTGATQQQSGTSSLTSTDNGTGEFRGRLSGQR